MINKNFLVAVVIILGISIFVVGTIKVKSPNNVLPAEELQWPTPPMEESGQLPEETPELPDEPGSYEEALKIAKAKEKKVLLFFSADWCRYCNEMKKTTLKNKDVQGAIENYVYYVVDTDDERALSSQYGVSGIPAFRIITDTEKVEKKASGYMSVKTFLKWLEVK